MRSRLFRLAAKAVCKAGASAAVLRSLRGAPVILMYHGVRSEPAEPLVDVFGKHVPADLFRQQLHEIGRGRDFIPLRELVEGLRGGRDLRGKVAVSFDDGYLNNLEAGAPVLRELGVPATFFLATGFIGRRRWAFVDQVEAAVARTKRETAFIGLLQEQLRFGSVAERAHSLSRIKAALKKFPWHAAEQHVTVVERELDVEPSAPWGEYRFMSWDQVRELAGAGFDLGAHTVNHAILARMTPAEAEIEVSASCADVRREVGSCSSTFCYPNGKRRDYNAAVMEFCRARFDAALSTELGAARPDELFELRRIPVDGRTSVARLASMLVTAH